MDELKGNTHIRRRMVETYFASGDDLLRDGREVDQPFSNLGVACEVRVERHADSLGTRCALRRCGAFVGGVNDLEVLLVNRGHEHLARLERLQEVSIVRCEVRQ